MSDPIEDLDNINVEAHNKLRRGKKPATPTIDNSNTTIDNNNNNNVEAPVAQSAPTNPTNITPTNPEPATQVQPQVRTPGAFVSGIDTGLAGLDRMSAFIGEILVPGAAGAGIGYGIVKAAGENLPAKYAIPVMVASAVVLVGGKLTIQYVAANSVKANGGVPAHMRWDIARAQKYIELARAAKVPEEVIFSNLKKVGAPVADAPATSPVVETKAA